MNPMVAVRTRLQRLVSRPSAYFSAEWERMPARERRWVTGLAISIVAITLALGIYVVFSTISDLEEGGADIREALSAINKNRNDYLEAKARAAAQEVRLGSEPPQLVADIESAAREETVQVAESNERPAVAVGKRWLQHDVDIKIRGVDLQALTKFLKRVETGPRPIFCTRLSLKRRFSEADKLDAELTAVAFERVRDGGAASGAKRRPEAKGGTTATTPRGGRLDDGGKSVGPSGAPSNGRNPVRNDARNDDRANGKGGGANPNRTGTRTGVGKDSP